MMEYTNRRLTEKELAHFDRMIKEAFEPGGVYTEATNISDAFQPIHQAAAGIFIELRATRNDLAAARGENESLTAQLIETRESRDQWRALNELGDMERTASPDAWEQMVIVSPSVYELKSHFKDGWQFISHFFNKGKNRDFVILRRPQPRQEITGNVEISPDWSLYFNSEPSDTEA